ncbi:hypothetical protein VRU48_03945 [Pedobacter sp. KR3-3]|uniref:Uncharacterized protein n=1 Tax=Pedobacter albus TaxID=3113905 RepID=A0ABU7I4J0_9SPHI|nr:hypothetical protein [Pedobacter sp. KR3-3]MEE1944246.1 hypothetical protein [Pedobacter sp. KR3-3]
MEDIVKISEIEKAIEHHLSVAKKLQEALDVIKSFQNPAFIPITPKKNISVPEQLTVPGIEPSINLTFADRVNAIISSENRVMLGKEIYERGGSAFNVNYKIFSAQLSVRVKQGFLKRYVKENARNDEKYYYGMLKFFNGDALKEEYKP